MINIVRSDGSVLVISNAHTLKEIPIGLCVGFGDKIFVVPEFTYADLAKAGEGHFSNLITIHAEWEGWPKNGS